LFVSIACIGENFHAKSLGLVFRFQSPALAITSDAYKNADLKGIFQKLFHQRCYGGAY
jgi:hypothetical protein